MFSFFALAAYTKFNIPKSRSQMSSAENKKLNTIIEEKNREIIRLKELLDLERCKIVSELLEKDYYEDILAHVPGHVYWLNKENIYLGCNDLHAKNAGLSSRHDVVGKRNSDMPWKDQAEEIDALNIKAMKSGVPISREEHAVLNGEKLIFLSQKVPMRNKSGEIIGILGISVDITEQKKLHTELQLAKNAADVANKAKTEFIANMSHDIRTPLSGVVGMSQLLIDIPYTNEF